MVNLQKSVTCYSQNLLWGKTILQNFDLTSFPFAFSVSSSVNIEFNSCNKGRKILSTKNIEAQIENYQ